MKLKNFKIVDLSDFINNKDKYIVYGKDVDKEKIWSFIVKNKINLFVNQTNKGFFLYTLDGSEIYKRCFLEMETFLNLLDNEKWFKSIVVDREIDKISYKDLNIIDMYPRTEKKPYFFGTFAIRKDNGMITTLRGKQKINRAYTEVFNIDYNTQAIECKEKATLNAPVLFKILKDNPKIKYIIHSHEKKGKSNYNEYTFPGTKRELECVVSEKDNFIWYQKYHGYLAGFTNYQDCYNFLKVQSNKEIDWMKYKENYPLRYLSKSSFDDYLSEKIDFDKKILDIGGGKGNPVWEDKKPKQLYLIDPFVEANELYIENFDIYDHHEKYDYIVARGSINYLDEFELKNIKTKMDSSSKFIFNTFKDYPVKEIKREFTNGAKEKGTETSFHKNGLIYHKLEFDNKNIEHSFYYRSLEDFKELLGLKLKVVKEKGNSLIVEGVL